MKRNFIVLALAASLAAIAGNTGAQQPPIPAQAPSLKPAAIVNGEPIMLSELEAVIKVSQPPSAAALTVEKKREIQGNALDLLIEDMLMRQYLRLNAKAAMPQEVDKELQELVTALAKDKQTLPDFLKATGQTEAQLRADVAARQQWKAFITPRLTDQVVKQYYDANKFFFDKVLVRASHVLVKVAPQASQADRQLVYNRIVAIRNEIMTGKLQFQDAAKKYSECPSKDNGGDIGLFPYKFAVLEPFAKAAFGMKIGDISDVVPTDFGYHIIKVTDRTHGQPSSFDAIKTEVKEIYAQEIYQYIIGEQKKIAKIERFL